MSYMTCKCNQVMPIGSICLYCSEKEAEPEDLQSENQRLRTALEEIREEYAGSELGMADTGGEAYAIWIVKNMYGAAVEALKEPT